MDSENVFVFKEDPDFTPGANRMSDSAYQEAKQCIPFISTDAIIVDRAMKVFFLPTRKSKPAQEIWPIGGGVKVGDTNQDAMLRNFTRETKLEIEKNRLIPLPLKAINYVMWKTEQIQNLHFPFMIELSPEERNIVADNLDLNEYDTTKKLQKIYRKDLENSNTINHKVLLFYYDFIFPKSL